LIVRQRPFWAKISAACWYRGFGVVATVALKARPPWWILDQPDEKKILVQRNPASEAHREPLIEPALAAAGSRRNPWRGARGAEVLAAQRWLEMFVRQAAYRSTLDRTARRRPISRRVTCQ
jgi:hypothetical protein